MGNMTSNELGKGLGYLNRVLKEFFAEDDRSATALVVAEIDFFMHQLLEAYFLPELKHSSPLLGLNSPLESFGSRIELAFRLGLIPPVFHHDLHLLRRIRNDFAHGRAGITLEEPKIRAKAQKLVLGNSLMQDLLKRMKSVSQDESKLFSARNLFRASASELLPRIFILTIQIKRTESKWPDFFSVHPKQQGQ